MDVRAIWEEFVRPGGGTIVYLIMDGLGGIPDATRGETELQAARTPNLDRLAQGSSCGLLEIVGPGITPGSGPGHLALFGYDPQQYAIGRGVLSALGIDFPLQPGDIAARPTTSISCTSSTRTVAARTLTSKPRYRPSKPSTASCPR